MGVSQQRRPIEPKAVGVKNEQHYHKLRRDLADRLDLITASISISYVVMLQQLKLNVAAFLSRISQVQTLGAKFRFQPSAPARNYVAVLSLSSV